MTYRSSCDHPVAALSRAALVIGVMVASLALPGCSAILGIESTSESIPADAGVTPDAANPLACADTTIASGDDTAAVNTEVSSDDLVSSCGGDSTTEQTFAWTAPVTDYYQIDTFGSGFDTVLALYDRCDGSELSCNNNVGAMPQSELCADRGRRRLWRPGRPAGQDLSVRRPDGGPGLHRRLRHRAQRRRGDGALRARRKRLRRAPRSDACPPCSPLASTRPSSMCRCRLTR